MLLFLLLLVSSPLSHNRFFSILLPVLSVPSSFATFWQALRRHKSMPWHLVFTLQNTPRLIAFTHPLLTPPPIPKIYLLIPPQRHKGFTRVTHARPTLSPCSASSPRFLHLVRRENSALFAWRLGAVQLTSGVIHPRAKGLVAVPVHDVWEEVETEVVEAGLGSRAEVGCYIHFFCVGGRDGA